MKFFYGAYSNPLKFYSGNATPDREWIQNIIDSCMDKEDFIRGYS